MRMAAEIAALSLVGLVVLAPLGREYADLRRSWGLGRLTAFGTTLLVLPSIGVGFALALPLASRPVLQWTVTVLAAILVYSAAAVAVRSAASPAEARGRR
jgi:ABC-type molybdate transport system permease subunit